MPTVNENEIRQYLLGKLTERACEQIENSLLVTDEGLEQIELIEDDLIDDYLSGDLSEADRNQFLNIFLRSPERRMKLDYLTALRRVAVQTQEKSDLQSKAFSFPGRLARFITPGLLTARQWPKLAGAALLILVSAIALWQLWPRTPADPKLIALNQAYASSRPIETRITGFEYAPFNPLRGANESDTNARILRERAERILLDAVAEKPTAANNHALGKYYLAEKRFDHAIEQFKAALAETPDVADLHNDLGAAFLEKARLERLNNQPSESLLNLANSLESLQQALKLQPGLRAAVFNRAICLEEMHLPQQAAEEWKRYLQIDPQSAWAAEARRRLDLIEKSPARTKLDDERLYREFLIAHDEANLDRVWEIFCQGYSTTGNAIIERLIDEYLAARSNSEAADAARTLDLMERLGSLSFQRANDPYARDIARYYRRITPLQQQTLLQARQELNEGRRVRTKSQPQAIAHYTSALSRFRQAGDEMESRLAECLMGRSYLRQSNLKKSAELLGSLADAKNNYLWLRGEALNGLADRYYSLNQPNEAIRASQLTISIANRTNNLSLLIRSLSIMVDQYKDLGDKEQSLSYDFQALNLAAANPLSHDERWAVNGMMALNFFTAGFQSAAVAYQQEALRVVLQAPNKELQISRAYVHLGSILGNEGRYTEAIALLNKACAIGAQMKGDRRGLNIEAYCGLHLANLQRKSGDLNAALSSYQRVIEINHELAFPETDFEAYRGKALTEISLGHKDQAQKDLAVSLDIFERNLGSIIAEKERTTFFDKEYDIYDAAIGFAYDEDPWKAFNLCERSRARSLLEMIKRRDPETGAKSAAVPRAIDPAQPLELKAIQQQLASGTKIIQYACLPDRLIVWCLSRDALDHKKIDISLDSLNEKAAVFIKSVSNGSSMEIKQAETSSSEIYRLLIEPVEQFLLPGDRICFIPDKTLNHLPFAALFSSRKQRYFIEDYSFLVSPSATIFLSCSARADRKFNREAENALVVGNPRFDRREYPLLPDLPAATQEAREIAGIFRRNRLLVEAQATEAEVKKGLQSSTIVHIAAHGVINERYATDSKLLLSKSTTGDPQIDTEDGALHTYEIAQMRLPRTRLAILSACQSGVERFYRGEGMVGLARSFIAADVPTVVASLWAVDSEFAAKLMVSFHRHLQKHPAVEALRLSQIEMLHREQHRHPYFWATFSVFGGDRLL